MASSINASTSGAGGVITTADNTGILNLQTASTTAVTIDASQNVGIGTASPTNKLTVSASAGTIAKFTDGTTPAQIYCGGGYFGFFDGAGGNGLGGLSASNYVYFQTNSTERMRIDSNGYLLVGTSNSTPSAANPGVRICPADTASIWARNGTSTTAMINFVNSNGTVGHIDTSGSNTSYVTSSDYRLKENIVPMTGALDKVAQLKPVTYTWKSDGSNGQGFIAHELQAVVPECVTGQKDAVNEDGSIDPQGIDTSFLVATLTAAIQEQQTLIVSQSELINNLTARVTALEAK